MNTDQMGFRTGEFRGGSRCGWTDRDINFVFGPVGSLEQITAGVKCEADGADLDRGDVNAKYAAAVQRPNAPDRKMIRLRNCGVLFDVHPLAGLRHGWHDASADGRGLVQPTSISTVQPNTDKL